MAPDFDETDEEITRHFEEGELFRTRNEGFSSIPTRCCGGSTIGPLSHDAREAIAAGENDIPGHESRRMMAAYA